MLRRGREHSGWGGGDNSDTGPRAILADQPRQSPAELRGEPRASATAKSHPTVKHQNRPRPTPSVAWPRVAQPTTSALSDSKRR